MGTGCSHHTVKNRQTVRPIVRVRPSARVRPYVCERLQVKFRYSEKATKNWKQSSNLLDVTYLVKVQNVGGFFQIFVAFSEYLNIKISDMCICRCVHETYLGGHVHSVSIKNLAILWFLHFKSESRTSALPLILFWARLKSPWPQSEAK